MNANHELLECLDNVTASLETLLAHYGAEMPLHDFAQRTEQARRARNLIERLSSTPATSVNADLLRSLCDLIAIASPDDAADDEEREAYWRAVAAKKAASVPCPLCTTAEQLCEACGGHGVIPKEPETTSR